MLHLKWELPMYRFLSCILTLLYTLTFILPVFHPHNADVRIGHHLLGDSHFVVAT